jgi:HAD superfamily hydrolase (TIGR01509 family)
LAEVKAVIFDMDGVIVDSERHWKQVASDFLRQLVPGWDERAQQSILGMSAVDVHALLVKRYGVLLSFAEFIGFYRGLARVIYGEKSELLSGVYEAIERLHTDGICIGLASSSPHSWIEIVLSRFTMNHFFSAVVSADDVDGKGKPAADIYCFAAEKLGIEPIHCTAIEDTMKGVQSAKSAGMKCIGYRNGFNQEQDFSEADIELSDFATLNSEFLAALVCRPVS